MIWNKLYSAIKKKKKKKKKNTMYVKTDANDHMPGNEPSTRLTLSAPRERLSVYVSTSFPCGFGDGTWDLIVLVPIHWFSLNRKHNGQL